MMQCVYFKFKNSKFYVLDFEKPNWKTIFHKHCISFLSKVNISTWTKNEKRKRTAWDGIPIRDFKPFKKII